MRIRRLSLQINGRQEFLEIPIFAPVQENAEAPLRAALSLQRAGHMGRDSRENRPDRLRFFRMAGVPAGRVFSLKQIHSTRVLALDRGTPADYDEREGDGLVTDRHDAVLCLTVADCLPLFVFQKNGRGFGLLHAGWKGTGIVEEALRLFAERYSVSPEELSAVIGPGIGSCCYTVHRERYEEFISRFGADSGFVRDGISHLDLREANLFLLRKSGLSDVTVIDNCTHCTPFLGSYRRDGSANFHNMAALFGRF